MNTFTPYTLTLARESRGLYIKELADLTTLSAGKIGKIEKGTEAPSIAEIQQFSTALKYPVTFFYQNITHPTWKK
jgi:transcriptional regulator with XRE-family HTH domain